VAGLRRRVSKTEERLLSRQPFGESDGAASRFVRDQELGPKIVQLLPGEEIVPGNESGDACPGKSHGGRRLHEHAPGADGLA
jgi:hypothetical protein